MIQTVEPCAVPTYVETATKGGWLAWRERARLAGLVTLEAELECMAADAANLMTCLVLERRPRTLAWRSAAGSLVRLFDAAATYAWGDPVRSSSAEGCVRVAVGIARARGHGVLVKGSATEVPLVASFERTLPAMVEALTGGSRAPVGYVELLLRRTELEFRVAHANARALARSLALTGWRVEQFGGVAIAAPYRPRRSDGGSLQGRRKGFIPRGDVWYDTPCGL